jgi:hypothetical protein
VHDTRCCVANCQSRPYAPAGTQSICKDHFLSFLTWRRRKGPQMFLKYAAMTMEERDTVCAEWQKTLRPEEVPSNSVTNV